MLRFQSGDRVPHSPNGDQVRAALWKCRVRSTPLPWLSPGAYPLAVERHVEVALAQVAVHLQVPVRRCLERHPEAPDHRTLVLRGLPDALHVVEADLQRDEQRE